jgi:hypothetical protein
MQGWKYGKSAIGHCASHSVETRDAIDIGISFEIAIEEMLQYISPASCQGDHEPRGKTGLRSTVLVPPETMGIETIRDEVFNRPHRVIEATSIAIGSASSVLSSLGMPRTLPPTLAGDSSAPRITAIARLAAVTTDSG